MLAVLMMLRMIETGTSPVRGDDDGAGDTGFHVGTMASFLAVKSPAIPKGNLFKDGPVCRGDLRHWTRILRMNRLSHRFREEELRCPPLIALPNVPTLLEDLDEGPMGRSRLQE